MLVSPACTQVANRADRRPQDKVICPDEMRQKRREREIDKCSGKSADEQPERKGWVRHPALNAAQVVDNLIEITVLHKIVPQTFEFCQLFRRICRRRSWFVRRDCCRHLMAFSGCRIGEKTPCLKLIIDKSTPPAMRTDARQILDLRAAFLADHPSFSFLKKYLLVVISESFIIIVSLIRWDFRDILSQNIIFV